MHIFILTKDALILGEKDEKYGYTLWASTDKGDVMFNNQTGSVVAGTQITAEEANPKETKKGKPYQRLSKVKVVSMDERVQQSVNTQLADVGKPTQLDRIEQKLDQLLGNDTGLRDPFNAQDDLEENRELV